MANRAKQIAESTDGPREAPGRVRLLFYNWAERMAPHTVAWHAHGHWQGEIVIGGPFEVRTDAGAQELRTSDVLLQPPGTGHEFRYPLGTERWITTRFVVPEWDARPGARVIRADATSRGLVKTLAKALPKDGRCTVPRARAVAEHCLAALVSYGYLSAEPEESEGDLPLHVRRAVLFIEENARRRTTLDDVARAVGYSRSHLAAEFRRHTGTNIKSAIDRARAETAARLLVYSDHSITEVASMLEFPDVYSFSRFFRRTCGRSPREYRRGQAVDAWVAG